MENVIWFAQGSGLTPRLLGRKAVFEGGALSYG